eukprot:gene28206-37113_t
MAYVISTSGNISRSVANAAVSCGFSPQYFAAIRPFGMAFDFNPNTMYKRCVGDHSSDENDWSLIMEDDAILSDKLTPIEAYDLASRGLAEINRRLAKSQNPLQHGFAYFGMCRGNCLNKALGGFLGVNCKGLCTHAYAVTKLVAQHLSDLVYNEKLLNNPNVKIDADQALLEYFARPDAVIRPYLLGDNLPQRGILVQYIPTEKMKSYHGGTSLHSNKFIHMNCYHFSPDTRWGSPGLVKEGFHSTTNNSTINGIAKPLSIGDAMFTYAALVEICFRWKTHPDYCASSFIANNANIPSVSAMRTVFSIPLPASYLQCRHPQQDGRKNVNYLLVDSFNAKVFLQPSDTVFVGRFDSHRYFNSRHSHTMQLLQSRFTFPLPVKIKSRQLFLSSQEIATRTPGEKVSSNLTAGGWNNVACVVASKESWVHKWAYYERAKNFLLQRTPPVDIFAVFLEDGYNFPAELVKLVTSKELSVVSGYRFVSAMSSNQDYNYSDEEYSILLLHRLSQCQSLILSGSTLSWWAGWLALNASVVLAPSDGDVPSEL